MPTGRPIAMRTLGISQPWFIEYRRENTAAKSSATPAIQEKSFTPTRLSQSNLGDSQDEVEEVKSCAPASVRVAGAWLPVLRSDPASWRPESCNPTDIGLHWHGCDNRTGLAETAGSGFDATMTAAGFSVPGGFRAGDGID